VKGRAALLVFVASALLTLTASTGWVAAAPVLSSSPTTIAVDDDQSALSSDSVDQLPGDAVEGQASSPGAGSPDLINLGLVKKTWLYIANGVWVALGVAACSIVLACGIALVVALCRLPRSLSLQEVWQRTHSVAYLALAVLGRVPYALASMYVSLFRGTPLLLQIYVIYFAIPAVIDSAAARWSLFEAVPYPTAIISGVAALSLNYGAYLSEVFRAGISSVHRGQREAAWALGMTETQTQRRIVLPQALRVIIPPLTNNFISLFKDTSLLAVIAVPEILKRSQLVGARYYDFLTPLLVAAAIYWVVTFVMSLGQSWMEHRLERDRAAEAKRDRGTVVRKRIRAGAMLAREAWFGMSTYRQRNAIIESIDRSQAHL